MDGYVKLDKTELNRLLDDAEQGVELRRQLYIATHNKNMSSFWSRLFYYEQGHEWSMNLCDSFLDDIDKLRGLTTYTGPILLSIEDVDQLKYYENIYLKGKLARINKAIADHKASLNK